MECRVRTGMSFAIMLIMLASPRFARALQSAQKPDESVASVQIQNQVLELKRRLLESKRGVEEIRDEKGLLDAGGGAECSYQIPASHELLERIVRESVPAAKAASRLLDSTIEEAVTDAKAVEVAWVAAMEKNFAFLNQRASLERVLLSLRTDGVVAARHSCTRRRARCDEPVALASRGSHLGSFVCLRGLQPAEVGMSRWWPD